MHGFKVKCSRMDHVEGRHQKSLGEIRQTTLRCQPRMAEDAQGNGPSPHHQNGTGGRRVPAAVLNANERSRLDEDNDRDFYKEPRLGRHLTDEQEKALREVYSKRIASKGERILDLMASYNSYLDHISSENIKYVDGIGLNEEELFRNLLLRERCVHDLNRSPFLPHSLGDSSYDCILLANGFQYLTHPEFLLNSIVYSVQNEYLGAKSESYSGENVDVVVSFTASCYKEKAISGWLSKGKEERFQLIRNCFDSARIQFVEGITVDSEDDYLGVVIGQFPRSLTGKPAQEKQRNPAPNFDIFAEGSDEANAENSQKLSDSELISALRMAYEALAEEAKSIGIPASSIPSVEPSMSAQDIKELGRNLKLMIQSFLSSGL